MQILGTQIYSDIYVFSLYKKLTIVNSCSHISPGYLGYHSEWKYQVWVKMYMAESIKPGCKCMLLFLTMNIKPERRDCWYIRKGIVLLRKLPKHVLGILPFSVEWHFYTFVSASFESCSISFSPATSISASTCDCVRSVPKINEIKIHFGTNVAVSSGRRANILCFPVLPLLKFKSKLAPRVIIQTTSSARSISSSSYVCHCSVSWQAVILKAETPAKENSPLAEGSSRGGAASGRLLPAGRQGPRWSWQRREETCKGCSADRTPRPPL